VLYLLNLQVKLILNCRELFFACGILRCDRWSVCIYIHTKRKVFLRPSVISKIELSKDVFSPTKCTRAPIFFFIGCLPGQGYCSVLNDRIIFCGLHLWFSLRLPRFQYAKLSALSLLTLHPLNTACLWDFLRSWRIDCPQMTIIKQYQNHHFKIGSLVEVTVDVTIFLWYALFSSVET
jgi:hypothetical protein